jgi:phosphatidylinositol glycan class N
MYFVDPVVQGLQTFRVEDQFGTVAPAKRLVLFVGDGVRADKAFQGFLRESETSNYSQVWHASPFLRSRILSHGTYGISHTRIPSKTRPGHIAITAGVYEDISALTAEWNPLKAEIDTVFTRSHRAWMWGSPDIVPVLKGNTGHQGIYADTYSEALEDFAADATQLDTWVFERVKSLLQNAKQNRDLELALKEDRSIFFLHLLGPDTTGHAYRPSSWEYLDNLRHVDRGVQDVTEHIEEFFGDNQTAFIFTSDHGMSDWGSHGDGNPDNTRTPLVAWGAGIAGPQLKRKTGVLYQENSLSSGWGLDHIQRHDVQQADVAALITYLLGSEFPASSVGYVPLSYLDADANAKARTSMANTKSLIELYRVKEARKKAEKLRFTPYRVSSHGEYNPEHQISEIQNMILAEKFEEAICMSEVVYLETRRSLHYLQTYDWLFLGAVVTGGYLSWIMFVLHRVIDAHLLQESLLFSRSRVRAFGICCILLGLFSVLRYENSPWRYYLYPVFPALFCEQTLARRGILADGMKLLTGIRPMSYIDNTWSETAIFICFLEALVCKFGPYKN